MPTFGRPMTARRTTSSSSSAASSSGRRSTTRSSRSPVPSPCAAETGDRLAEPEAVELAPRAGCPDAVDLVRGDDDRLVASGAAGRRAPRRPAAARRGRRRRSTRDLGVVERGVRLLADRAGERVVVGEVDAAGVDQREAPAVPLGRDLVAVARDARALVHDRLARPAEAVDERATCRRSDSRRRRPSSSPGPGELDDPRRRPRRSSGRSCRARRRRRRRRSGDARRAACRAGRGSAAPAARPRRRRRAASARRRARSSGAAVRKTLTSASGATTVPMSRPSATQSPSAISARWRSTIACAHAAGRRRRCDASLGDLRRADRGVTSSPSSMHAPSSVEADLDARTAGRAAQARERDARGTSRRCPGT